MRGQDHGGGEARSGAEEDGTFMTEVANQKDELGGLPMRREEDFVMDLMMMMDADTVRALCTAPRRRPRRADALSPALWRRLAPDLQAAERV